MALSLLKVDSNQEAPLLSEFNGLFPANYGTLLNGPHELKGHPQSANFELGTYRLENGKSISFPFHSEFSGKLIVDFSHTPSGTLNFVYKYQKPSGELCEKISLFEHTMLFNWETGKAFALPEKLRSFIRKMRFKSSQLNIHDFLIHFSKGELVEFFEIWIDSKPLDARIKTQIQPKVFIQKAKKTSYLSFSLRLHGENDEPIPIPNIMQAFAFNDGLLQYLNKKSDAYSLMEKFLSLYDGNSISFSETLAFSDDRAEILDSFTEICKPGLVPSFESQNCFLYMVDKVILRDFIVSLIKGLGISFCRFSSFNYYSWEIEIPKGTFLESFSSIVDVLQKYNFQIYYDESRAKVWNPKINIERNQDRIDWFDLKITGSQEDLKLIQKIDVKSNFFIKDGNLIILDQKEQNKIQLLKKILREKEPVDSQLSELTDRQQYMVSVNKVRIFEIFEFLKLGFSNLLTQEEIETCKRLLGDSSLKDYPIEGRLKSIARPYQQNGYRWLRFLYENNLGACLADDMGLGKTLQTIMFLSNLEDQLERVLIICPVSIILNWELEFKKFSSIKPTIYYGEGRSIRQDDKVIITSYGVLRREINSTFKDMKFDILVLDEVQNLKNFRSVGAVAARQIQAKFRITLTGTPVENDILEFFNIIDLSVPGIWGTLNNSKKGLNDNKKLIRKLSRPFILRRTKEQVLTDLPPKVENNLFLNFSSDEENNYNQYLSEVRLKIKSSVPQKRYGLVLGSLLRLRQLCLWQENLLSTKISFLIDSLDQILQEGHQAIIFSQFTTYLDIIEREFLKKDWTFSRIDGSYTHKKRQSEIEEFQKGQKKLFLISLKAGGVGLNLTAASYVFLMDPWWNPAVENQAIDRAYRIGQKNKLTVYRPIIKNTVEEKVLTLQDRKKELFKELLPKDDDEKLSEKLTLKDFEELIF